MNIYKKSVPDVSSNY